jgi:IS5 family transposase
MTDDFSRSRLEQIIDLRHPLAVLAGRMLWAQIESALAPVFASKTRDGKAIACSDLLGATIVFAGSGQSAAGRPHLSIPLMAVIKMSV